MAKKGFKLPGVTPLKQTGSTSGSFFQPLNPRNYGASLTSPYANPQSYSAYFPSSTMGGAKTITDLGNTFSDIVTTVSGKGTETDTDTSSDVSGSDITISATGQLPTQTTTDPGLERGSNPKLEERIAKAEAKGNLKKAARLQAKQDRNIVRQTEGEKRIQARQDEKLDRVTARQEGLTKDFEDKNFAGRMLSSIGNIFRSPTTMKNDSPNKFLGGIAATTAGVSRGFNVGGNPVDLQTLAGGGGMLGRLAQAQLAQSAGTTQAQQDAAASTAAGGATGGQTLNCTPVAMSYDPPLQANEKGGKTPVFNLATQGMAETAFGTPAMRQASVGAAFQMTQAQEDAFGPGGHSENPGLYKNLK